MSALKVMIHACPKRMWYVENFLIPSLKSQGITDIILWNDDKGLGNLASFIASAKYIKDNLNDLGDGIWHIQDDVLLSSRFRSVAEKSPKGIVYNGISTEDAECTKYTGIHPVKYCWWSFPCVYIPNRHLAGFYSWFIQKCLVEGKYKGMVKARKYDDFFFCRYLKTKHKGENCYNIVPNIVQHVDYLIGGRIANSNIKKTHRAVYWNEEELEESLAKDIKEWIISHDNEETQHK